MRQGTYLNVILTVNAALLGAVVWTQVAGQPALAQTATAQTGTGAGVPNAADQRHKMNETLLQLKASVDSMHKALSTGKLKVEVTNLDQIKRVEVSNIDQLRASK